MIDGSDVGEYLVNCTTREAYRACFWLARGLDTRYLRLSDASRDLTDTNACYEAAHERAQLMQAILYIDKAAEILGKLKNEGA
jgi:hypothetical protein